jgi:hypothetical protein
VARVEFDERIPAGPFVAWVQAEIAKLDEQDQAQDVLAARLGIVDRSLYRFAHSLNSESEPTDNYARVQVEDMLDAADVRFEEIYPEIAAAEDTPLEADAYCGSCHEIVTPIGGACPWCDRPVQAELPERMFCKREDAMSFPAVDGNCWRCGGELKRHVPRRQCGCGCGTTIPRFDDRGREREYVRGHAPRSLERRIELPIEPFARWLEQQMRDLDPIEAVARRVGLRRDLVLAILNRHEESITSIDVRRALWIASRAGQGKGMPPRPGSTRMGELYPDAIRSTECPSCGGRKAKHAERCRDCATAAGVYAVSQRHPTSLTDDQLQEARGLRDRERLPFLAIAEQLQPRTRMSNVESVKNQLLAEFRKRGWPTDRLDREQVAA